MWINIIITFASVALAHKSTLTQEPISREQMALPAPPLVMKGNTDFQPLDTWLGDMIVRQFRETPRTSPIPTQDQFRVTLPKCLGSLPTKPLRTGLWIGPILDDDQPPIDRVAVSWQEKEFEFAGGPELSFHVGGTWTAEAAKKLELGGEILNDDQALEENILPITVDTLDNPYLAKTRADIWTGDNTAVLHISNCGGRPLYTIRELVSHYPNSPVDHAACTLYGSCDGQVFVKYIISKYGDDQAIVAQTANTRLFADRLQFFDGSGNHVANLDRLGGWNPTVDCPDVGVHKDWMVSFADSNVAELALASNRWVMGVFTTVMTVRDDSRLGTGLESLSAPLLRTWAWTFVGFSIFVVFAVFAVWGTKKWLAPKAYKKFLWLEHELLPRVAFDNN